MGILDELAQDQGFVNEKELHTMVAMVDLTDPDINSKFMEWKSSDGSRDGLKAILDAQDEKTG